MTSPQRLERDLPMILGDLAMGPYPDYIDDVLLTTARRRQRPAWMFAARWLPMIGVARQPVLAPQLPWRAISLSRFCLRRRLCSSARSHGCRSRSAWRGMG
jgi:hypothetical protein